MGYNHLDYLKSLDEPLAPTMPDTWAGHARLEVDDYDELTEEQHKFARKLAGRVAEQKPNAPPEVVAEKAVEMAKKKV